MFLFRVKTKGHIEYRDRHGSYFSQSSFPVVRAVLAETRLLSAIFLPHKKSKRGVLNTTTNTL